MAPAAGGGTLRLVPLRWRWALAIVIAATGVAVGAFVPNARLSSATAAVSAVAPAAHQVPSDPDGCVQTSCNRGAPTPAAPPLATGALWTACTSVIAFALARLTRRRRRGSEPLPQAVALPLFHPPQFVRFA